MDQIFDRLGNLLRSMFDEDGNTVSSEDFADPDMQSAWEELDDFLKAETSSGPGTAGRSFSSTAQHAPDAEAAVPPELHSDYRNLEVPIGSSLEDVNRAYKRLVRIHHPDRHASDPAEMARATKKTQAINYSYYRVRKYLQTGNVG